MTEGTSSTEQRLVTSEPTASLAVGERGNPSEQTIQLLVDDEGNRTAVQELLARRYEVETEQTVGPADLYLVDEYSFPAHHEALQTRTDREHPTFCPVVLIRRECSPIEISLPPIDERNPPLLVNDVVEAPLKPESFFRRLDSLLARRSQSQELHGALTGLQARNEQLEAFASTLTHDLRNPIQVISGRAQHLKDQWPERADDLETILNATGRMRDLVEDLLTIAENDLPAEEERVCLGTIVRRAWETVETRRADLVVEDAVEECRFDAASSRLLELFENLFRNAVDHAGEEVTVRVGTLPDGFFVADDGPGIPDGKRERVFEMGYSTTQHGTGLGLNIVAEIVDAHGWDISLADSPSGGARFEITGIDSTRNG